MKLENIGFYTLSDNRAKTTSKNSCLIRGELLITDKCNLKCPYCRGIKKELQGELSLSYIQYVLQLWVDNGLKNVRLSGGEPTLHHSLITIIKGLKNCKVERIAISTNGTQPLDYYKKLIDFGVNDFSISLDGGCCSVSNKMTGGIQSFDLVSNNIKELSKFTYVTVGIVFNEINTDSAIDTIKYINSLNPSDIRIISSAQYNQALYNLLTLPKEIVYKYPILSYRINNYLDKRNVRGIRKNDCSKCHLVKDDIAVVGKYHFPCIIYLREGGQPIGEISDNFREERYNWFLQHNSFQDKICLNNCLDVCIDYNNKVEEFINQKERV